MFAGFGLHDPEYFFYIAHKHSPQFSLTEIPRENGFKSQRKSEMRLSDRLLPTIASNAYQPSHTLKTIHHLLESRSHLSIIRQS